MPKAARSKAKQRRHKKWLKRAQGFRGRRRTVFKLAKEAVLKAGQYSYRDRRNRKSDMRRHWNLQINAAARSHGTTYSRLINSLRQNNIELDRKVLAKIASERPEIFTQIIGKIKK